MASLTLREKRQLEEFLEMGGGYVLDFSNRTFADLFQVFGVEIDDVRYMEGHSGSKANRMRRFWTLAPDQLVGRILLELIEYAESYRPNHPGTESCRAIATRLQSAQPVTAKPLPVSEEPIQDNPRVPITKRPVDIFFSYAHEDEELMHVVRRQLVVRERLGEIVKWHDRMIPAGDEWRTVIDDRIKRADVILLFMSPDFLESQYCYEIEGQIALQRHRDGTARIIPVVLRACDWVASPFGELQALPKDGVPMTQWPDKDQASLDVARGIMHSILGVAGDS